MLASKVSNRCKKKIGYLETSRIRIPNKWLIIPAATYLQAPGINCLVLPAG